MIEKNGKKWLIKVKVRKLVVKQWQGWVFKKVVAPMVWGGMNRKHSKKQKKKKKCNGIIRKGKCNGIIILFLYICNDVCMRVCTDEGRRPGQQLIVLISGSV